MFRQAGLQIFGEGSLSSRRQDWLAVFADLLFLFDINHICIWIQIRINIWLGGHLRVRASLGRQLCLQPEIGRRARDLLGGQRPLRQQADGVHGDLWLLGVNDARAQAFSLRMQLRPDVLF